MADVVRVRVGDLPEPLRNALGLDDHGEDECVGVSVEEPVKPDALQGRRRLARLEMLMRGGLSGSPDTPSTTALIRAERDRDAREMGRK